MTVGATRKKTRSPARAGDWKGKQPHLGQWKSADEAAEDPIGFVTVSVKLRPAEKEDFKLLCKKLGVTPNRALRTMARQAAGFLEVTDSTHADLEAITRQISGVARNINQIAKAGNRTLSPDYHAFMEDRRELGVQLSRLEDIIREIVNVGKRRSDGLRQLKEAIDRT